MYMKLSIMALIGALTLTACTDGKVAEIIKKAEQGDSQAQLQYARLLKTTGNGVDQDWTKAVEMLSRSAQQRNADAQWELGLMYENADHISKDEAQALDLYRKSADAGSPIGLYLVAHCYQHGIVVEEDRAVSDSLYGKSYEQLMLLAPQEDIYVLNFVGSALFWGDGVAVDRAKAFGYYLTSAQKGNPETQYKIGNCYETGQGTAQDMTQALGWYQRSAAQGYPDAIKALERLQNK